MLNVMKNELKSIIFLLQNVKLDLDLKIFGTISFFL